MSKKNIKNNEQNAEKQTHTCHCSGSDNKECACHDEECKTKNTDADTFELL